MLIGVLTIACQVGIYCYDYLKIHIPLKAVFALGTQREKNWINNTNPILAYPMRTISHWLALGLTLGIISLHWALLAQVAFRGPFGSARLFRYPHVGIPITKS